MPKQLDELLLDADPANDSPSIRALRERIFADIASEEDFAAAIHRGVRTIQDWRRENPPIPHRFIGRSVYIVVTPALVWLEKRFAPEQQPRKVGRPRKI